MTSFPNKLFILMKRSPASHFCTSDHITESLEKRQRFNWINIINFSKKDLRNLSRCCSILCDTIFNFDYRHLNIEADREGRSPERLFTSHWGKGRSSGWNIAVETDE